MESKVEESRRKTGEIMSRVQLTELIESGAHFGHLTRRWNPKMKQFIFMEKNGIHIIDLKKTQQTIDTAADAMTEIVSQGKRILFVGTKKQAKHTVAAEARRSDSNWVSERWLGGMLTNFQTIRKSIKRLQNIEKMESDGTFEKITKKERLVLTREKDKLRKVLDGVETMSKLPGALFIVDIKKESIAVNEALRLNVPIFAIVDTNCDPDPIDFVIPANDDASRAVEIILKVIADAVIEGNAKAKELRAHEVAEREKEKKDGFEEQENDKKEGKGRVRKVRFEGKDDKRGDRRPRPDRRDRQEPRTENKPEPNQNKPADA
jgi:small subunit ribosomal protein S2